MNLQLLDFNRHLQTEEKSAATIEKYLRDVRFFLAFLGNRPINKENTVAYKTFLQARYAPASINSMLIALNCFLRFIKRSYCCVKLLKIQRQTFISPQRELTVQEYKRLVKAADIRLSLVLQTICGTGIRVSELQFITIEAAHCGEVTVSCKGKTRTVFLVSALRTKLLRYAAGQKITKGPIFLTRMGKPLNRSNVWRAMKALCKTAGVSPDKVFPHNLRHLFARTFYHLERDIAKLADILGHSSINTTRIYILSTGFEHRRKMENMRLII